MEPDNCVPSSLALLLVRETLLGLVTTRCIKAPDVAMEDALVDRVWSLVRDLVDGGDGVGSDEVVTGLEDGISSTSERASRPLPLVSMRLHGHMLAHPAGRARDGNV